MSRISVTPGDCVLLGGSHASHPSHWVIGNVLWVGPSDLLVERSTKNGLTWREIKHFPEIRAVGTAFDLAVIRENARKGVADFEWNIRRHESILESARDALWEKLAELVGTGLKVITPDFDAIKAAKASEKAAMEQADAEEAGQ